MSSSLSASFACRPTELTVSPRFLVDEPSPFPPSRENAMSDTLWEVLSMLPRMERDPKDGWAMYLPPETHSPSSPVTVRRRAAMGRYMA